MDPANDEPSRLLPLPNELICEILDWLPAHSILRMGQTCQTLRAIVNKQTPALASKIINRKRTLLLESQHPPSLVGLPLLEALRKWVLYHGPVPGDWTSYYSSLFATEYTAANPKQTSPDQFESQKSFISRLAQYLLHVDQLAHREAPSPCRCVDCRISATGQQTHCGTETAVKRLIQHGSGWQDVECQALRVFRKLGAMHTTKRPIATTTTSKAWLAMVKSIIQEPIEQYSANEKLFALSMLTETLYTAFPAKMADLWHLGALNLFTNLMELPRFDFTAYRPTLFALKMDLPTMRRIARRPSRDWRGMTLPLRGETRGVRATRQFCLECFEREEKMVDPDNLLLKAFVFEELVAVPRCFV